ncbi:MAG TPA: phosphatidylinositol-specific phospholipase C1-like protein [Caulobacteraceae bacterium]|nr:phosphatidylinositol-specific phospholipase C1-like protein [Caulobacteraceae bacterium]
MTPILAALAIAAGCDLEKPSGAPGCERAVIDRTVRMDQIQALGTHNSYKRAIPPAEMAVLKANAPQAAIDLDYSHLPLTRQLDAGARALELDVMYDPEGGRYADPLLGRFDRAPDGTTRDFDAAAMKTPGLKVTHIQDIDFRSVCALFVDCLREIRAWSQAHPDHVPILITMNLKDDDVKAPGTVHALKFDAKAMDTIDAEIRQVFPDGEIIRPDDLQGRHASLAEAARDHAWPLLGAARGKVLFAMDEDGPKIAAYQGTRRSLEGRVMFVNAPEASPLSAYITLNEPLKDPAAIRRALVDGRLVRTRADADTAEARRGDTTRRDAAFALGAQYVSTDYMTPDPRFGPYQVTMPGAVVARLRPGAD